MMRFRSQTSFFAIEYEKEERGVWILKESQPPHTPDENSLIESPEYQQHMSKMGRRRMGIAERAAIVKRDIDTLSHLCTLQRSISYAFCHERTAFLLGR